jgi:hypothetical protein
MPSFEKDGKSKETCFAGCVHEPAQPVLLTVDVGF